jgi:hypothetical protein
MAKAKSRGPVRGTKAADLFPPIDQERVRDISVIVYKARLGRRDTAVMIETQGGEKKLRERAAFYDPMTLAYFQAFDLPIPRLTISLLGGE